MINSSSQKIFNNSLIYAIGTIATKATAFLLIPFYTYNLSDSEYGIATTITTFVGTFGIVVMLSLRAAIIRFYNEYTDELRRVFIGTVLITVIANSLVVAVALCLLKNLYMDFLFKDIAFFPLVFIGIMSLATEGIYLVYQSVLQAKQDGKNYSINSFSYLIINFICVIIFVVLLKKGVLGVVLSNFITNFSFAVYGIISMRINKILVFRFDKGIFIKSIKYSLPILPHNLSNDLNSYATKIVISNYLTYALSGLYSLASQFASVVNIVQYSINLAFRPWFMEQIKLGDEGRKQIKHMSEMIMSLFSFIAVTVALFCKEIVQIVSSVEFLDAWYMVPVLIFVQLITFVYYSHIQSVMYNIKMSKYASVCSFTGLAANIILSIVLANFWGIFGIVFGQLFSKIILSIFVIILNKYAENVNFGLKKMCVLLLAAAVFMGIGILIISYVPSQLISILLRIVLVAVAFGIFICTDFSDYKMLVLGFLKKR